MKDSTDVVVMGGGPTGAAAALTLRRVGLDVTLLTGNGGCSRRWQAGEALPPAVQISLKALQRWDDFLAAGAAPCSAINAYWGTERVAETNFLFHPHGSGWHVDRRRFDAMLLEAVQGAGGRLLAEAWVHSVERSGGLWSVTFEGGQEIKAPFLVDATGRSAWLARRLGVPLQGGERLAAVFGTFTPESPDSACDPLLLLESVEQGWWYSLPLPDGDVLAAHLTDADLLPSGSGELTEYWRRRLAETHQTRARLRGFRLKEERLQVRAAGTTRLQNVAGEGWLAAGDAAVAYDPLAGVGVARALESGIGAASAIAAHLCGDSEALPLFAWKVESDYQRYRVERTAYYREEQRWPDSPFWERRQRV